MHPRVRNFFSSKYLSFKRNDWKVFGFITFVSVQFNTQEPHLYDSLLQYASDYTIFF